MIDQKDEQDQNGGCYAPYQFGNDTVVHAGEAAVGDFNAVGQRGANLFVDVFRDFFHALRLAVAVAQVATDGDAAYAVAPRYGRVVPFGRDVGNLSHRHPYARQRSRYQQVVELCQSKSVGKGGVEHHGHAVVAFPNGSERLSVQRARQIDRQHALRYAESGGFVGLQSDAHVLGGFVVVAVHPCEFGLAI